CPSISIWPSASPTSSRCGLIDATMASSLVEHVLVFGEPTSNAAAAASTMRRYREMGDWLMTERHALVLGGGGVAGIAWMTGLLAGLAEAGDDISGADVIIGTSAGAAVAAQLGSGLALDELYARQAEPERQAAEIAAEIDLAKIGAQI